MGSMSRVHAPEMMPEPSRSQSAGPVCEANEKSSQHVGPKDVTEYAPIEGNIFDRVGTKVSRAFIGLFEKIGYFCGSRPWTVVLISIVFVILCAGGLANFKQENRSEKLWVPNDSQAQDDKVYVEDTYEKFGRFQNVLLHFSPDNDVLQPDIFDFAWRIDQAVKAVTVEYQGETYDWNRVCLMRGDECLLRNVFESFPAGPSGWDTTEKLLATMNSQTVTSTGEPFDVTEALGGVQRGADGQINGAHLLSLSYFVSRQNETLDNGEYVDPIADAWEEKLLDALEDFADNQDQMIKDALTARGVDPTTLKVRRFAFRSFSDEFGEAIQGDLSLLNVAIIMILVYSTVMLSRFGRGMAGLRLGLSMGGVLCIGLSIVASFGLCSAMGLFYSPLMSVLPFLLLGIGVDDMFVIVNAFDLTDPSLPIPDRLSRALGISGTSVTVTSLTDFFAFLVGSQTSLPALSNFCVYAAFGIMIDFFLQVTLFAAFLCFDTRRMDKKSCDPCCCCFAPDGASKAAGDPEAAKGDVFCCCGGCLMPKDDINGQTTYKCCCPPLRNGVRGFMGDYLGKALTKPMVKAFVLLLFSVITGVGITGTFLIEIDADVNDFIPPGSYLGDWWNANQDYLTTVGAATAVYMQPAQYSDPAVWDQITEMYQVVRADPYIANSTVNSWFEVFKGTVGTLQSGNSFYADVNTFLNTDAGRGYSADIVWVNKADPSQGIKSSKITANHVKITKSTVQVDAMDSLRDAVTSVAGLGENGVSFAYSDSYLDTEQYKSIQNEIVMNLGLALVAVAVIIFALIVNPLGSLIVFLSVTSVVINIVGYMHFWGLTIDSVTVIMLVIALGLAVDYSAHVGHAFMVRSGTADERLVKSLRDMGAAVFNGAMSTFLAVVVLSLSVSYVFVTFFKQLFLCITIGLAHGLILVPVVMSLANPKHHDTNHS